MKLAMEGTISVNAFLQMLYEADAWLCPQDASRAAQLCFRFLRRYEEAAVLARDDFQTLFLLAPKLHCLHHIAVDLWQAAARGVRGLGGYDR